jgi:internalin A
MGTVAGTDRADMNNADVTPESEIPSRGRLPSPGCLFATTVPVILVSVCFWIGWRVYQQQARLAYFRELGAKVQTEPARPVWLHDFVGTQLGEQQAAGFTEIIHADFFGTQIADDGMPSLSGLNNLQSLALTHTQVTDDGLANLSGLTSLSVLRLGDTPITGTGLRHLSGLNNLQILYLHNTQLTDDGLQHLSGLTGLRELYLENTHITDAGLQHLSGLTNLETLYLDDTQVTDAGLEHLRGLTNLQELSLGNTQITGAGVAEFRSRLPTCAVVGVPPKLF